MQYSFDSKKHVHTLDDKPLTGTSQVMSIVNKPGLVYWAAGEAVKVLGWTNPKFVKGKAREKEAKKFYEGRLLGLDDNGEYHPMSEQEYLKLLDDAYSAHGKTLNKAATKGKDLHAELEDYVKLCIKEGAIVPPNSKEVYVQQFADWALEHVEKFLWSEMHTYSEEHWLGGITDAGAKMKDGTIAIIDFKSSKEAYPTQFFQCGGYDVQIREKGGFTSTGEKIMEPVEADVHIIIPFGAEEFSPAYVKDSAFNRRAFKAALFLYRANQKLES